MEKKIKTFQVLEIHPRDGYARNKGWLPQIIHHVFTDAHDVSPLYAHPPFTLVGTCVHRDTGRRFSFFGVKIRVIDYWPEEEVEERIRWTPISEILQQPRVHFAAVLQEEVDD